VYMLSSKMEWTPKVSRAHLCCWRALLATDMLY
jgi:hypothetical protein